MPALNTDTTTATTAIPNDNTVAAGPPRIDRGLLNPRFEGYKLQPPTDDESPTLWARVLPLSASPFTSRLAPAPSVASSSATTANLSFRRIEARARFNHLFSDPFAPATAYYFDAGLRLIYVTAFCSSVELAVSIDAHPVCQLPPPPHSSAVAISEFPSIAFYNRGTAVASDGAGALYIIKFSPSVGLAALPTASVSADCVFDGVSPVAARVLIAAVASRRQPEELGEQTVAWALAYHSIEEEEPNARPADSWREDYDDDDDVEEAGDGRVRAGLAAPGEVPRQAYYPLLAQPPRLSTSTKFIVELIRIEETACGPRASVVATAEAATAPQLAVFDGTWSAGGVPGFVLAGSSRFADRRAAPASSVGAEAVALNPPSTAAATGAAPAGPTERQPPYAWSQTPTDVTVVIPLRPRATARQVRCVFTARGGVSLRVAAAAVPGFPGGAFYDAIVPGESLWTLEDGGSVLTLHVQKAPHEGGGERWTGLWAGEGRAAARAAARAAGRSEASFAEDGWDVPETVDPSELRGFVERLEAFTAEGGGGVGAAGAGGPQQRIATADPVEDEDLEGKAAVFVRFAAASGGDGGDGGDGVASVDCHRARGFSWLCAGPEASPEATTALVCLRSDVDGLVFRVGAAAAPATAMQSQLPPPPPPPLLGFAHVATFDALGYVVASKRDRRFVALARDLSVALVVEATGRLFAYERAGGGGADGPRVRASTAAQRIWEMSDAAAAVAAGQPLEPGRRTSGGGDDELVLGLRELAVLQGVGVARRRAFAVLCEGSVAVLFV